MNKVNELQEWLKNSINNQEQIKEEYSFIEFSQWNKGYLEALLDMDKVLNESR